MKAKIIIPNGLFMKLFVKLKSEITLVREIFSGPFKGKYNKFQTKNYVFTTQNLTRYKFPTHINDLVMDRSEARFSEVFFVIIEPGKAPPLHKHDDTEQIFYITEGKGSLTIENEFSTTMQVIPGDVVRIPVGALHYIRADKGVTLKYLAIDCFGSIRNQNEPTWNSHVRVLCDEQGWDYESVINQ